MSITEELRNFIDNHIETWLAIEPLKPGTVKKPGTVECAYRDIAVIADRIDEAHEKELSECKTECIAQGVLNGIEYVGVMPDSELAKLGLIRLPVDVDGVPIHIGDMMSVNFTSCSKETHGKVLKLELSNAEVDHPVWVSIAASGSWMPDQLHHCKPTPAERIRGFANEFYSDGRMGDGERDRLLAIADEMEGES